MLLELLKFLARKICFEEYKGSSFDINTLSRNEIPPAAKYQITPQQKSLALNNIYLFNSASEY